MGGKEFSTKLNPDIIEYAKGYDENSWYEIILALLCLYHKDLPDKHIRQEVKDFIIQSNVVTREGEDLVFKIPIYNIEIDVSEPNVEVNNGFLGFTDFIKKYISLFPTQSITGLSYAVSGNTSACTTKMKRFLRDFNKTFNVRYNREQQYDVIIKATQMYLNIRETKGWAYTKKNSKFIQDKDGSVLESYCSKVIRGEKSSEGIVLVGGIIE